MHSFRDIIGAWPTIAEFAVDLQVIYVTANAWNRRDMIPASYWQRVVRAAETREIPGVTVELMAGLAARGKDGGEGADSPADVLEREAPGDGNDRAVLPSTALPSGVARRVEPEGRY